MLVIRSAQLQAMRKVLLHGLEDRLMEHAQRYFPEATAGLGPGLRQAIADSIERARSYGLEGDREICKYLNLQLRFGRDFDRDPAHAWAHPLLESSLPGPPKMERLYALALRNEGKARSDNA